jgi:DNA mismatch endonuclease (patch repair protein)
MDRLAPEQRSALMSRIRSTDTKPEFVVRRLLHGLGYRYVLHDRRLPGRPDLVFPSRGCVVQVQGCFWHAHGCSISPTPKSNTTYWSAKIQGNVRRDARNARALRALGWRLAVVWECQTKQRDLSSLTSRLTKFLG